MKVLQINMVYKYGSTGKIIYDIHQQLIKNGNQSVICYGRGKNINENNVYKIAPELVMKMQSLRSKITGYAYSGCIISTNRLIKIIKDENPDVVHLHCLNGYFVNIYKLLQFLKKNKIKAVLTLHAEFMYTAGCGHALDCEKWKTGCGNCPQKGGGRPSSKIFDRSAEEWKLMANAFEGFDDDLIIAPVSRWLCERVKQSPFLKDKKFIVVTNGLDTTNTFKPTDYSDIKAKYNLKNEKIILHVTPNFKSTFKGGKFVVELAHRLKKDKVKIIIVGFNGEMDGLPKNIIPIKHTQDQRQLAAYYSMADVTVLTSKKETFSMVCAESLACGTPIVGFKAGAPETISIEKYSEFVKQGDMEALECAIRRWLNKKQKYCGKISKEAGDIYSKEQMYKKYMNIYKELRRGDYYV